MTCRERALNWGGGSGDPMGPAYAGAPSRAAGAIGERLAIIGRLADAGPKAWQGRSAGVKEV